MVGVHAGAGDRSLCGMSGTATFARRSGADLGYRTLLPASLVYDPDVDGPDRTRRSTRDWIVDVVLFLSALLVGTLSVADAANRGLEPPLLVVDVAIGFVACCALWVRRRWPVGLALAMLPVAMVSSMGAPAAGVALFTVAVHRRFPVLAALTALHLLTIPVFFSVSPAAESVWVEAIIGVLLTLVIVAWGMIVRARRQLVMSLRERAQRAEAEQQLRVEQARHHERERIAREMHDVLAHRISLLSLHAGALEFRPDAPPDEVARAAGVIRDSAHQALQDLREVIGVLRGGPDGDAPMRPQPTFVDLPGLVEESRQAGMRVRLENTVRTGASVPASIGRNAYRIVQEGLTNARKHAPDTAVTVATSGAAGDGVTIEIRNPLAIGRSTSDIPGAGAGLVGLAERVNLAGGRLEHGPTPAGEFRLTVWLPWPA